MVEVSFGAYGYRLTTGFVMIYSPMGAIIKCPVKVMTQLKLALGKLAEEEVQEPYATTEQLWVAYDNVGKAEVAEAEARFAAAARADMGAD
jgi:hypothetical protein